nr:unnamed protein product [Callosobruchus chinensis]
MSNRPISVVELERRRLATAASLSKDLEAITAWGLKNMVELNPSKTQYSAGKKLGYLFRARKFFSPSNLRTLYKAQIRPSLEYCSHIWGAAAPTTLSILDAVQRRAIRLNGDPALTCYLQPLSHQHASGCLLPYAPGDIESVVENERCRIYWNYSFPSLELVQVNKPDIVLLDHQQKTMFVIEFSAPAEVNIVSKEEEKRTKYQELLGQLRRLWPDYAVSLLVMVIRSLGGMRNTLLSALRVIPVCRVAAHFLATRMQKAQLTFSFLRSSRLKSETEGFIMACQDGVFNTLVYRSRVMGVNVPDARCRACRQAPETLMHLLSACRTYAGTYVHRHNAALRVRYYHLRHSYGIDETPVLPYAPRNIESVVENERCRNYWNYSFPTLELVQANKPDIDLLDHQQKTMFVIEFSAPAEVNIVFKEEEKRTKYQELLGQLRRLWPDYAVSLLVMVIGSLGGMRNTLLSALRAIPVCRAAAHTLAARMQKAVILGSLRLLRAHDTRTQ